jgi:hypothetical protein
MPSSPNLSATGGQLSKPSASRASPVRATAHRRDLSAVAEAASKRLGHADPKITERGYRRKAERAKPLR